MSFNPLPTKASVSGRGRRVVYLDQNVVSELARLRLGRARDGERTTALRALLDALREATFEKQNARCVESFFRHWESSGLVGPGTALPQAEELFHNIWELLVTHSWGLKFHGPHQVGRFQTLVTVAAKTGLREYACEYLWRGAFNSDPHERNEKNGIRLDGDLFVLGVPWRPDSALKEGWAAKVETSRAACHYASFEKALRELRAELQGVALEDNGRRSWARTWGSHGRPMDPEAVRDFVRSDAYGELPSNDVLTRIGARVLSDRGRPLQDGDGADMRILSLAIPYCDLVITDNYMASVANGLCLGAKYSARIIPATTTGLREATTWLSACAPTTFVTSSPAS
jgi:hypothetical protein